MNSMIYELFCVLCLKKKKSKKSVRMFKIEKLFKNVTCISIKLIPN